MATACPHTDRKLYARGICKACYLRDYHNRTRQTKVVNPQIKINIGQEQDPIQVPLVPEQFPLLEGSSQILNFIESNHDITFEPELERNMDCFPMMKEK